MVAVLGNFEAMYQLTAEQVMGAPLERLDAYLSCLRSKLTGKDGLQVTVARQANHVLVRVLCVYFVCVCVCAVCLRVLHCVHGCAACLRLQPLSSLPQIHFLKHFKVAAESLTALHAAQPPTGARAAQIEAALDALESVREAATEQGGAAKTGRSKKGAAAEPDPPPPNTPPPQDGSLSPPPPPGPHPDDDDDESEGDPPEIGDMYRVIKAAGLRELAELDSPSVGGLAKGSVVEVLEVVALEAGKTRIRCDAGWTSLCGKSGAALMEKVGRSEPTEHIVPAPAPESSPRPPEMTGGLKQYEVKRGRKKFQLQVGGMGLQVLHRHSPRGRQFDHCSTATLQADHYLQRLAIHPLQLFSGGKPAENYLYMGMGGWGESENGDLDLALADGSQVLLKTEFADEIAQAMSGAARKLAKHARSPG